MIELVAEGHTGSAAVAGQGRGMGTKVRSLADRVGSTRVPDFLLLSLIHISEPTRH